jgi:putative endonuclease
MFYVYILKSKNSQYYIGYTNNIEDRLRHHNSGASKYTRINRPWSIIYTEKFVDKKLAWLREKQIKSYKGGVAFKKLIKID